MAHCVVEPELVDLRCPSELPGRDGECHPGKLLARLYAVGERPSWVYPDNLIELECSDCKVRLRRAGRRVARVLHRFDFAGQPAGTLVVDEDRAGLPAPRRRIITMKTDWRDAAACAGMDTELFFPVSPRPVGAALKRVRAVKETCRDCPVRMDCLEFALVTQARGIWGGLTEEERRGSRLCRNLRAQLLAS